MSRPPIWARDEPRGRGVRSALSRAEIVRVAVGVADAEGLEAVSMRRVARELRSGAMSLYHYFDSRDELLDLMADTVAAEMLVPSLPSGWRDGLRAIAHRSHDTFLAHPWLLLTLQERPPVTPNLLRHIEQTATAVASLAGRVPESALTALATVVDDYTVGFTLREINARSVAGNLSAFEDPHVRYLLESGEFPMLSSYVEGGAAPPARDFSVGLEWVLDGFAASLS